MNKQNKGITLIALVITIVVLVILVGVSVSVAINTGLIANSKKAVSDYDKAQNQEQLDLDRVAGIMEIQQMKEVKAGGYTETSNKKYISKNEETGETKTAYIPAGFTVSNVPGETSIEDGLVIYSGDHSSVADMTSLQTTVNQYVWVPVENPSDMYGTDINGNKLGKLYNFGNSTSGFATSPEQATALNWTETNGVMSWIETTGEQAYREPAYLADNTEADDSIYNVDAEGNKIITEKGIQDEFNRMINSIETYKGFYIGRYELTGTVENPKVVKGTKPLTSFDKYSVNERLRWYGIYTMCQKVEQNNEDAQGNVTTSMIWGSQWDQTIKKSLVATTDSTTGESDFLTNKDKYGVYYYDVSNSSIQNTGTKASAFNIFNMTGNADEVTMEALAGRSRALRGYQCISNINQNEINAAFRQFTRPNMTSSSTTSRVQLYL